ncbi:hypothetical protein AB0K00_22575 [Dactylosporangium sp. NPDC049525]|uniref:hypothetical protein n=1 Tax=Dactylosporangium sp. NPDC049525 TaxID=3154730 RepID=UPI00342C6CD3
MLSREEGLAAAAAFLEEEVQGWAEQHAVRTMPDRAFIDGSILIVPYDSVASLDGGDESERLGGNVPVRVDLSTGECDYIDVHDVMAYEARGFVF